MKIAVTGGGGFIGRWFCDAALAAGHEPVVIGRSSAHSVATAAGQVVEHRGSDYSAESLASSLDGCEAAVHLAAARFARANRLDLYAANIAIAGSLLTACRQSGLSNVVMLSSLGVYSSLNPLPWRESQRAIPATLYGASKLAIESLADACMADSELRVKSLRVAQVLGHGEREGYMLSTFLRRAFAGEALQVYGQGVGRREYVYVKDVADAILTALNSPGCRGPFNIGTGTAISCLELAQAVNQAFRNEAGFVLRTDLPEVQEHNVMDVTATREQLHWRAGWTLAAALEEIRSLMEQERGV